MRSSISGRYWFPLGASSEYGCPEAGAVVAFQHAIYRVFAVRDLPRDRWDEHDEQAAQLGPKRKPRAVGLRPIALDGHVDPVRQRAKDRWYSSTRVAVWHVYRDTEHYPVCAACSEPMPCRDQEALRAGKDAIERMSRFEMEGVCPSCSEPVTGRQKSLTFSDNLEVPGGPPVTFHLRSACWSGAYRYEEKWVAADPERRRATLSCAGHLTNHNDGTYGCTEFGDCPGVGARHRSMSTCSCPDCHARPWTWGRGCHPDPKARPAWESDDAAGSR